MKNARLKQELDRVAGLTAKYLGRPFTHMPQGTPQMSVSSLDLSMGGVPMGGHHQSFGCGGGMWRDLDLLSGAGLGLPSSDMPAMHLSAPVTDAERPLMARMAARAMDNSIYSSSMATSAGDIRVEGSQDTAVVCMSPVALFKVFMDDSIYSQASCPTRGSLTSSSMYDVSVGIRDTPTSSTECCIETPFIFLFRSEHDLAAFLSRRLLKRLGFEKGDAYFFKQMGKGMLCTYALFGTVWFWNASKLGWWTLKPWPKVWPVVTF
ncbi:hypothetical protein ZWY2020_003655 [Hordeum vulgare]|nr:hypothetical protein ZWY2020_003655 [Hordeum vulgare]